MSRYINPYTDFGFKKLFGQEASADLLLDFLNEVLPPPVGHHIAGLTFKTPEGIPDIKSDRKAVFDIFCHTDTGERFIVEMQKAEQAWFKDRAVFYSTFPIRDQAVKGAWNFKLAPVYCVGVLDFVFNDENPAEAEFSRPRGRGEERDDVLTVAKIKDQHGRTFYEKLTFAFLEMPRFQLREEELTTRLHKWLYFLKNLESFEKIPEILNERIFEKGFRIAELAAMTQAERDAYAQSMKHYSDIVNVIDTAEAKGVRKGLEQGIAIGEERGERKGLDVAREKMRRSGLSEERITEILGE